MDATERTRLQSYLRKLLGSPQLEVAARSGDEANLTIAGKTVGELTRDDDEGELSYFVSVPVAGEKGVKELDANERTRTEALLRARLAAPSLAVRPRPRKTDSAEVYVGEEFIGTLSREDDGYFLTCSILEMDLDESGED